MQDTKIAKCAQCCPTGGAILTAAYNGDSRVWRCNNCHAETPRVSYKPTPKVTPSQARVIRELEKAGWTLETSFIGRNVWVIGRKDRGNVGANLIAGDSFYGTIGPRGSFSLKLQRFGGDKVITTDTDIYVYLG